MSIIYASCINEWLHRQMIEACNLRAQEHQKEANSTADLFDEDKVVSGAGGGNITSTTGRTFNVSH